MRRTPSLHETLDKEDLVKLIKQILKKNPHLDIIAKRKYFRGRRDLSLDELTKLAKELLSANSNVLMRKQSFSGADISAAEIDWLSRRANQLHFGSRRNRTDEQREIDRNDDAFRSQEYEQILKDLGLARERQLRFSTEADSKRYVLTDKRNPYGKILRLLDQNEGAFVSPPATSEDDLMVNTEEFAGGLGTSTSTSTSQEEPVVAQPTPSAVNHSLFLGNLSTRTYTSGRRKSKSIKPKSKPKPTSIVNIPSDRPVFHSTPREQEDSDFALALALQNQNDVAQNISRWSKVGGDQPTSSRAIVRGRRKPQVF